MHRLTFTLIPFVLLTIVAFGQERKITGRILDDETRNPIQYAYVVVLGSNITAMTDYLGYFEAAVDSAHKTLTASHPRFVTATVIIPPEDRFQFTMERGGDRSLPDISEFYSYLSSHTKYPDQARRMGAEGTVWVQFDADSSGKISNVRLVHDVAPGCGRSALQSILSVPPLVLSSLVKTTHRGSFIVPVTFSIFGTFRYEKRVTPDGVMLLGPIMIVPDSPKWVKKNTATTRTDSDTEPILANPEQLPEFPGGMGEFIRYIQANRQFPKRAIKRGISGKVFVSFVVNTDGSGRSGIR